MTLNGLQAIHLTITKGSTYMKPVSRCSAKGARPRGVLDQGTPERWERRPEESQQWSNGSGGRKPCSASTQKPGTADFPVTGPRREAVRPWAHSSDKNTVIQEKPGCYRNRLHGGCKMETCREHTGVPWNRCSLSSPRTGKTRRSYGRNLASPLPTRRWSVPLA
jgi:hypothetical protein